MTRLMNIPEVGDKLRMVNNVGWGGRNVGDIFEVISVHVFKEFVVVTDDDGADLRVIAEHLRDFELVTESLPSIVDLVANLGRRLSDVEAELAPKECEVAPDDTADMVEHPPHYTQGDIEVIDYIDQVADGYPGRQAAYVANIIKYVSRAPYKNGVEDVKKCAWYLHRLIDAMETEASE